MSLGNIREELRRMEFNKTEPEVLAELIRRSKEVGNHIRDSNRNLSSVASNIAQKMKDEDWIFTVDRDSVALGDSMIVGVDGSNYPIEGLSGEYHVPTSAAAIIFPKGLSSKIQVKIDAGIPSVQVTDQASLSRQTTLHMLAMETKLLHKVSQEIQSEALSVIMLDGPIVDPPRPADEEYLQSRCGALKQCLENGATVIGVVKSPRERFFCNYLAEAELAGSKSMINAFKTDFYLMAQVFNKARKLVNKEGPLRSSGINLSEASKAMKQYKERNISVFSFFYQNDGISRPLRIDWCEKADAPKGNSETISKNISEIVAASSLPRIPYPIPVYLAHRKCNIRRGCAEILFEDIMTRARATSRDDAVLIETLKGRT